MTTYTLSGFVLEENSGGDILGIRDATFEIVAKDSTDGVSYTITGTSIDDEPTITWGDDGIFGALIDGSIDPGEDEEQFTNQVIEVSWANGTSYVANFYDEYNFESYVFVIGGDDLPDFANLQAFLNFFGTVTLDAPTGASGFGENTEIPFAGFPDVATTENDVIYGTDVRDVIASGRGNDKVFGLTGNDVLNGGAGRDKLFGAAGGDKLLGGKGWDWLYGQKGFDVLNGGQGNDVLVGGLGADVFIFAGKFGKDVIKDFNANSNLEDIDLSGVAAITGFFDLKNNHMVQDGDDVLITAGVNSILLENVDIADLHAADFIF